MASDITRRRQLWDLYQEELVYWCLTRIGFPLSMSGLSSICYIFEAGQNSPQLTFIVGFPLILAGLSLFNIVSDIVKLDIVVVIADTIEKRKEKPVRGWWDDYYVYWHNHSFNLKLSKEQWNPIAENTHYKITYLRRTQLALKLEPYQSNNPI